MIHHMRECALILASASPIFTAAIAGDLPSRLLTDPELQSGYTALSDRAHYQPSIYAHFLTDTQGTPPTPNQYLTISNIVQEYLAENTVSQHAWHVDNMTHPPVSVDSSGAGHRKYLHTTNSAKSRSAKRSETLHRFCTAAHQRWFDTPASLRDTPFTCPPAEFSMHGYVIFLLFRSGQAAIAEILCSELLQVWVEGGGGFNACPAGRSVTTAKRVGKGEWAEYERWVREKSGVVENMRVQRQRAEEWRRALEWEDEESKERDGEFRLLFPRSDLSIQPTPSSTPAHSLYIPSKMSSNNATNATKPFTPTAELHDLGATRFDRDTAAPSDRDTALLNRHIAVPVITPQGRAPPGLEAKVHAWTTFQFTTEDVDRVEELKGDLHGGMLHRVNRAARGEVGGGVFMGNRGKGSNKGTAQENKLCGGRKGDGDAAPMAKGMAEEMGKDMFWSGPIV
ncbi:hypothetical protein PSV09DRAFT_2377663 [Bipolaris maydis]|nr:hypothetical protein J3E74DRAFT_426891 [Bipolaris maydis]KAJ6204054.1 hypothetical protein PSV09DRAFT_2377663 [Bipolaris maydis]